MKTSIKLIFLFLLICINIDPIKPDLWNIDSKMFDEIIEKTEYVFVMLHKTNSEESEAAEKQFEESANKIDKFNIVFGIIETYDENAELLKKIGYEEYPKVLLFYRGYIIPFDNNILTENVDIFVNMKLNNGIKKFENFEEIKKYRTNKETVIYVGQKDYKDEIYLNFLRLTKSFDDIIFMECHSQDCMENYDSFSGIVSIHNGFSNENFNLDKYNMNQLTKFIKENTKGIFPVLDKQASDLIFNKYSAGVFLFYNKEIKSQKKFIFPFTSAAKHLKHSIHTVISEFQSEMGNQVVEILKLNLSDCPKVFIIDSRKEEIQLYRMDKEITEENILDFVVNWGLRKLTPIIFSEEIPQKQTFPLLTLVGKNYNDIVVDSDYDILVYYMKPDCPPCKIFEKKLRKVANVILKIYGDVMKFGKINGELNDIEKVSILNYPAVNYYKKDNKIKPVKYEINDFDIENMVKFIAENNQEIEYAKVIQLIDMNEESVNANDNDKVNSNDKNEENNNAKVEVNYVKDDI